MNPYEQACADMQRKLAALRPSPPGGEQSEPPPGLAGGGSTQQQKETMRTTTKHSVPASDYTRPERQEDDDLMDLWEAINKATPEPAGQVIDLFTRRPI